MRVTRKDYLRMLAIEKEIRGLSMNRPAQRGFDYRDWPLIKPNAEKTDFFIKMVHWEYIPEHIFDEVQLINSRENFDWLNAKAENLFVNEKGKISMWKEGALTGRCLVPTSGYYEWRHIGKIGKKGKVLDTKDKIPYYITLKEKTDNIFFLAGICREWTNEKRGESADTFAIVTTAANELCAKVHNTKKRMPTILTDDLAKEWLFGDLSRERITEIANYQYDSDKMIAWPVEKNFIIKPEPDKEFVYENLPPL